MFNNKTDKKFEGKLIENILDSLHRNYSEILYTDYETYRMSSKNRLYNMTYSKKLIEIVVWIYLVINDFEIIIKLN